MNVAVIGLGKLGCPLLATLANHGHDAIGVDVDKRLVETINKGQSPIKETGVSRLVDQSHREGTLCATTSLHSALPSSILAFVVVPTPSLDSGEFSTEYVSDVGRQIGNFLAEDTSGRYRLFVLVSTVMPQQTQSHFVDAIEKESGKQCGDDYGVCYAPAFIALGSVVQNLLNPDLLLIGESDSRAGEMLEEFYTHSFCTNKPIVVRTNFANAEIAKLALNCFVTTKISYANMLSEMCERIPGGDARVVTRAIGADSRIGRKFLRPGTAYGGPCLPRDNHALIAAADKVGIDLDIAEATDRVNKRQITRLFSLVKLYVQDDRSVGILGLSYKPTTSVTEHSMGLALAELLAKSGNPVTVYDPQASLGDANPEIATATSIGECIRCSQAIVIATPWSEFAELDIRDLMPSQYGPKMLVDCWGIYANNDTVKAIVEYVCLGVNE